MPLSRRSFVKAAGTAGVGALALPLITGRGREAAAAMLDPRGGPLAEGLSSGPIADQALQDRWGADGAIRLDSNENPRGPGETAIEAIRGAFGEASRYADVPGELLHRAIAVHHGVGRENVVLGCGSSEVLRMAMYAFASAARPLVTAAPSYEDPVHIASVLGAPVRAVPVDGSLATDLDSMAEQSAGAGLVYLCNPNNPTATLRSRDVVERFIASVARRSPDTCILVDEAYFDFVEDPTYGSMIPLATNTPRVIVARTFSKIYGMAGLRMGYGIAHPETIGRLARQKLANATNQFAAVAALASLGGQEHLDRERQLNREARTFTERFFADAGYTVVPSQTNFLMIDIRRDVRAFQAACRARGVLVGRPFPPLRTHLRVSVGTMDEMRQAVDVFRQVLATA